MESIEWNEFDIKIPALTTTPVNVSKNHMSKVIRFRETIAEISEYFETRKDLEETAALLSRMIARRKNSFRKMSGFKSICKVNASLCRLLRVNLSETLRNLHSILPEYRQQNNLLPSRNIIDHILTRFIGVYKIFERICYCCTTSAEFFTKLLSDCFFIDTNCLLLAILAKLWTISKEIGCKTADHYKTILEHRECFPKSKYHKELSFPEFLTGLPNEVEFKKINVVSEMPIKSKKIENKIFLNSTDPGTVINRDSLKPDFSKNKKAADAKDVESQKSLEVVMDSQKWTVVKSKKKKIKKNHPQTYKFAFNK